MVSQKIKCLCECVYLYIRPTHLHLSIFHMHTHTQTGVFLGFFLIVVLTIFPGEPFDYSKPDGRTTAAAQINTAEGTHTKKKKKEADTQIQTSNDEEEPLPLAGGSSSSSTSATTSDDDDVESLYRLLAQEDRLLRRLQPFSPTLMGLLGLSEEKVRQAARKSHHAKLAQKARGKMEGGEEDGGLHKMTGELAGKEASKRKQGGR